MASFVEKLDELLEDDKSFSTRAGLRLAMEALREAMDFINLERRAREESEKREVLMTQLVKNLVLDVDDVKRKMGNVFPFYKVGIWIANVVGILLAGLLVKFLFP